jgi:hypothetical protein
LYGAALRDGKVVLRGLSGAEIASVPPKWYSPPVGVRYDRTCFSLKKKEILTKENLS